MTDVLHHISRPRGFFLRLHAVCAQGGVAAMIEPWVARWSWGVYTHLHYEPFLPETLFWEFPINGPLSGPNGALPWILF
jgi:hypothetical protein